LVENNHNGSAVLAIHNGILNTGWGLNLPWFELTADTSRSHHAKACFWYVRLTPGESLKNDHQKGDCQWLKAINRNARADFLHLDTGSGDVLEFWLYLSPCDDRRRTLQATSVKRTPRSEAVSLGDFVWQRDRNKIKGGLIKWNLDIWL